MTQWVYIPDPPNLSAIKWTMRKWQTCCHFISPLGSKSSRGQKLPDVYYINMTAIQSVVLTLESVLRLKSGIWNHLLSQTVSFSDFLIKTATISCVDRASLCHVKN